MYSSGLSVKILNPTLNLLVLENSAMKHRLAWSTVAADSSGHVMLVNWFWSVGLSHPWPNIRETVLIPKVPPVLAAYLREVLPGTKVGIDSVV